MNSLSWERVRWCRRTLVTEVIAVFSMIQRRAIQRLLHMMMYCLCFLPRNLQNQFADTCMNLKVPLDYDNYTLGPTVVAFIRHEGNEPEYNQDIMINPGGPGGSGIEFLLGFAQETHNDYAFPLRYNLVSFDPRGMSRKRYLESQFEVVHSDDYYSMRNILAHAEAFGNYCTRAYNGTNARYAGTAAVAQDMLHFLNLHAMQPNQREQVVKLNFFGAIYGTHVGHMLLNGAEDVPDYYNGDHYGSIVQINEIVALFFERCYRDGTHCAFYQNDTSPAAMQARFDAVLKKLHNHPLALIRSPPLPPTTISWK
ncbi:hypothetical protein BU23DRAFT_597266 [Bimuria novae-zelandiae CBS 107.79]|uniref:AB hydrolase-1 domain-containing protein n=1 Tax=Bimuria novae-zelandiae CBS 107.79 TaxID=1447943 RepID=A0A6A5VGR3_9PLEO|nr:hypothetical protein BU23DRAFT_597266 [Bimuria novae-zelandiae CBS 107.79]